MLAVADAKRIIKMFENYVEEQSPALANEINLGMLEPYENDKGSIVFQDVKCTPITTKRYTYNEATKKAIEVIKEQAQHNGDATQTTTTSLRFTF